MKIRLTQKYWDDLDKLSESDQQEIVNAVETVQLALQGDPQWYSYHRIKRMQGHPGIWEGHVKQNLVFTFEYGKSETGEKVCLIRRVGTHDIYRNP